jgi:hypothetical protein
LTVIHPSPSLRRFEELKMELSRIDKKIAEAQFFLDKMTEQETRIIGDKEPFDYYLSAFLNAARIVDYRLRHEQGAKYKPWRTAWDSRLNPKDRGLMEFLRVDRNVEVHAKGSKRNVGQEGVKFGVGEHRIDGGLLIIGGPPGMEPDVAYRPAYEFTIDGTDRKVTEACAAHLALLRRMVAEFQAAHP